MSVENGVWVMHGVDWKHPECIHTVSIMLCPEAVWGRDLVTKAYGESPAESWQRLFDHVKEMYEEADDSAIIKLIGKKPVG